MIGCRLFRGLPFRLTPLTAYIGLIFRARLFAAWLTVLTAITARLALAAIFARLLLSGAMIADMLRLFAARLLRALIAGRLLAISFIVTVIGVDIVLIRAVAVAILIVAATVLTLEPLLHLRLGGSNDAVIVLGVLKIVFRYHSVTGALGVASKIGIFLGDMLGRSADFDVRTGTVIGPAKRISALAVEVAAAAIVVAAAPSTAFVLLSWPHLSFTNSLSSLIRAAWPAGQKPDRDFARRAQIDQGDLSLVLSQIN